VRSLKSAGPRVRIPASVAAQQLENLTTRRVGRRTRLQLGQSPGPILDEALEPTNHQSILAPGGKLSAKDAVGGCQVCVPGGDAVGRDGTGAWRGFWHLW
jgi:hypothetical protein